MAGNRESDIDLLLRALAHPMRRSILRKMPERETISPSQLAPALEDSVSNVSYHFRMLEHSPAVELVEEKQVRGATQHFYRYTVDQDWVRKLLEEPED